jgi:hypothetical protein
MNSEMTKSTIELPQIIADSSSPDSGKPVVSGGSLSVRCIDIEIHIMRHYDIRQNLIVPNVTDVSMLVGFETDMLVLTPSGYATGFEIKVTKGDLRADLKKKHIKRLGEFAGGKSYFERYFGRFKYFNYAVPVHLQEAALEQIPDFCGLWVLDAPGYPAIPRFYQVKEGKKLFDYKWSEGQQYALARLGTMRILAMKEGLSYRR